MSTMDDSAKLYTQWCVLMDILKEDEAGPEKDLALEDPVESVEITLDDEVLDGGEDKRPWPRPMFNNSEIPTLFIQATSSGARAPHRVGPSSFDIRAAEDGPAVSPKSREAMRLRTGWRFSVPNSHELIICTNNDAKVSMIGSLIIRPGDFEEPEMRFIPISKEPVRRGDVIARGVIFSTSSIVRLKPSMDIRNELY
jgi:hypothetical protein